MKVVHIIDGPFSDLAGTEFEYKVLAIDENEETGEEELQTLFITIKDFNTSYRFQNYFRANIEPMTEEMFIDLQRNESDGEESCARQ